MIEATEKNQKSFAEKIGEEFSLQMQAMLFASRFLEKRGYTVLDKSQSLIVAHDEESNTIVFADVVISDEYLKNSTIKLEDFEKCADAFFERGVCDSVDIAKIRFDAIEIRKYDNERAMIRHRVNKFFEE